MCADQKRGELRRVAEVMALVTAAGFKKVALVTEQAK